MREWNILVTAHWGQERKALWFLAQHGEFKSSGFKDVLRGHVEDVGLFLGKLELMRQESPGRIDSLSQVVPLEQTFNFELPDFMEKLKETVLPFAERIAVTSLFLFPLSPPSHLKKGRSIITFY